MSFYLFAFLLGLCLAFLAKGIFLSLRIFKVPDITTDGSYTLGAVITGVMLAKGYHSLVILPFVLAGGATAGAITGFIHTRLKIDALLSGILVMTGLYSVNLVILGRSNLPLVNHDNIFNLFHFNNPFISEQVILIGLVICGICGLSWLMKTDFGLAMRATGSSESMMKAMGVNTDNMKIKGLAIANALTALSGYLVSQYQGYVDINMGIGIVIVGLGAVMMGESFLMWKSDLSIVWKLVSVVVGAVLLRLMLAITLSLGIDPNLLKIITSGLVLVMVTLPHSRKLLSR